MEIYGGGVREIKEELLELRKAMGKKGKIISEM